MNINRLFGLVLSLAAIRGLWAIFHPLKLPGKYRDEAEMLRKLKQKGLLKKNQNHVKLFPKEIFIIIYSVAFLLGFWIIISG